MASQSLADNENVHLLGLFQFMKKNAFFLLSGLVIGALLIWGLSFKLPLKYEAELTIRYRVENEKKGSGANAGGAGGVLAGLLKGASGSSERATTMAILNSRKFLISFLQEHDLKKKMYAHIWDGANNKWLVEDEKDIPSDYDAIVWFQDRLNIDDRGLGKPLEVSFSWHNPKEAFLWPTLLIGSINKTLRNRAINSSEKNIAFLNEKFRTTAISEVRNTLSLMLQIEIQSRMFTEEHKDFAFEILDPPVLSAKEDYASPNHRIYMILGGVFGFMGTFMVLLYRTAISNRKDILGKE